jgi:hypothetical protein
MEIVEPVIKLKSLKATVALEPLGCIHAGNVNFNETKFNERLGVIARDPNRYTIGMGDYADSIMVGAGQIADKRWNPQTIDKRFFSPDDQYAYVTEKFRPIRKKILGLLEGNHDYSLEEKTGHQYVREMAKDLGVSYLGYVAFVKLRFEYNGKVLSAPVVFAAHTHFSGLTAGGNLNKISAISSYFDASVYLTGHTHRTLFDEALVFGVDGGGELVKYPKILASTGTFMETYVKGQHNYAEKSVLQATKTGTITIEFEPGANKIHAHK